MHASAVALWAMINRGHLDLATSPFQLNCTRKCTLWLILFSPYFRNYKLLKDSSSTQGGWWCKKREQGPENCHPLMGKGALSGGTRFVLEEGGNGSFLSWGGSNWTRGVLFSYFYDDVFEHLTKKKTVPDTGTSQHQMVLELQALSFDVCEECSFQYTYFWQNHTQLDTKCTPTALLNIFRSAYLTGGNWQKWKKSIPDMSLSWNL